MGSLIQLIIFSICTVVVAMFPFNSLIKESRGEMESSGSGPDKPVFGITKVVRMDPSVFFRRGFPLSRALPHRSRLPFPPFLSRGRPAPKPAAGPQHARRPQSVPHTELKKKQAMHVWQRVTEKGDKTKVSLKDTKQTCTAVPFTQRVTADGCQSVSLLNRLCFGQCSSLFVPSDKGMVEMNPATGAFRHRAPCSRCAPVRARAIAVPLLCGDRVREKRVMLVEECKCETSRDLKSPEVDASIHL